MDYLDTSAPAASSGHRWAPIVGLTVGGLVVAGAAAYGVTQFLGGGESPAAAVPDDAFGYLALDLDPGADQQLAAYRFLKKFPAIADQLSLSGDEDLRKTIFDELADSADCDGLDFEDDVAPWLGNSVAMAGRMGDDGPEAYVLVAITDQDAAATGFDTLSACGLPDGAEAKTTETAEDPGVAFTDDYMVLADDKAHATKFIADAEEANLADDATFQSRVEKAGGEGFVTGYLAPSAADAFVESMTSSMDAASTLAGRAPALAASPTATESPADSRTRPTPRPSRPRTR